MLARSTVLLVLATTVVPALDVNVRDYGAKGDGTTDDTSAFQQAINAVSAARGGTAYAPVGNYRIAGVLQLKRNVTLSGVAAAPTAWTQNECTTLLASAGRGTATGTPFISFVGKNATLKGVTIYYPDQVSDATPVPYPWCLASQSGNNHTILDCLLVNPYQGIHFKGAGRHLIRNVYGQPFARGLLVDEVYDVGRIENVHFWPFGAPWDADNALYRWMRDNAVAFEFGRSDWQSVLNTFCFGYGVGYRFYRSSAGVTNGTLYGIGADQCRTAILVEAAEAIGVLITGGQFVGNWGADSVGVRVWSGTNGIISFSNCSFWGTSDHIAVMEGEGRLSFDNCLFKQWNKNNNGAFAIEHLAGTLSVQNCDFWSPGRDIHIGPQIRRAYIIGNDAEDGLQVVNDAGKRVQAGLNAGDLSEALLELEEGN